MVRASGTEPKIRIMVESENEDVNKAYADKLQDLITKKDGEV